MTSWNPTEWTERLEATGDLKSARGDLDECLCCPESLFFLEGMRGRLSSLMLDLEIADHHFQASARMGIDSELEDTDDNLRRATIVDAYSIENNLLMDRVPDGVLRPSPLELLHQIDWRLQRTIALSTAIRAIAHLHTGDDERAQWLFDKAIESHVGQPKNELMGLWRIGRACCEHNLGNTDRSIKTMESAEWLHSFAGTGDKLNSTALSAALYAVWDSLGETSKAEIWRKTILDSGLPTATVQVFVDRASLIISRCVNSDRLVLL